MNADRAGDDIAAADSPIGIADGILLGSMPIAACVCDSFGRLIRHNSKVTDLFGYAPETGVDFRAAFKLFRPDGQTLSQADDLWAPVISGAQEQKDIDAATTRADGSLLEVRISVTRLDGLGERDPGMLVCLFPVHATPVETCPASEAQQFLSAIIDTTPESITLVAENGQVLQMNPAGLRMVQAAAAEDIIGKDICDLVAPEYKDEWRDNHRRICGGERLSWTFDMIALGGERLHMETHAVPLKLPSGDTAQLAIMRDISDRRWQEAELRESERRLREILESLPAAIYTTDVDGTITFYNRAAADFWGWFPELGKDKWCGSWRLYRLDGTAMAHDECPMAVAIREQRPIRNEEAIVERPDGSRAYFAPFPTPLRDESGRMVGAINMLVDITERKRAEEHQLLLINELNHRVKNTLATVQSIAAQTFRGEETKQYYRWFEGRLFALSKAHDLLTQRNWEGAYLHDILTQAIAPMASNDRPRIELSGPELQLPARLALSLAMTTHELCTNAAKYGALSTDKGSVRIEWHIRPDSSEEWFHLSWLELSGPPVSTPTYRGFGTRLIERGLPHELGAQVQLSFHPTGLSCDIRVPLNRFKAQKTGISNYTRLAGTPGVLTNQTSTS